MKNNNDREVKESKAKSYPSNHKRTIKNHREWREVLHEEDLREEMDDILESNGSLDEE